MGEDAILLLMFLPVMTVTTLCTILPPPLSEPNVPLDRVLLCYWLRFFNAHPRHTLYIVVVRIFIWDSSVISFFYSLFFLRLHFFVCTSTYIHVL